MSVCQMPVCIHAIPIKDKCAICFIEFVRQDNTEAVKEYSNRAILDTVFKLVSSMEHRLSALEDNLSGQQDINTVLFERIKKVEVSSQYRTSESLENLRDDQEKLVGKIESLCEMIERRIDSLETSKKLIPHKCPVCDGECVVLISNNPGIDLDECHVCYGKGIVWG